VTDRNTPFQPAEDTPLPLRRNNFARIAYVVAVAVAMLGWLWLIAWIARRLL